MLELIVALILQDRAQESFWDRLELGGQIRGRIEYRNPVAYAPPAQIDKSDVFYLSRIRAHLKLKITPDIDAFVQAQDDRQFNHAGPAVSNSDNIDIHQGHFHVRKIDGSHWSVKAGRQELLYGDQRVISPLDWSNTGRAWDALKIRYEDPAGWVDVFGSMVVDQNDTIEGHVFYGIYASYTEVADHEFDLYALGRYLGDSLRSLDERGNIGTVQEGTFGIRIKGKTSRFDYTVEGVYQTGEWVETAICAWAVAATLGYTVEEVRFGVEYTGASGDPRPADGRRNTFTPPFPFSHFYQGYADVFAWKNGHDAVGTVRWKPCDWATFQVDVHTFWLDQNEDAWYNAAGMVIRRDPTGSSSSFVGNEIDVHLRLTRGKWLKIWTGYSRFFAGEFVDDTGRSPDMDWFFFQLTIDL